MSMQNEKLESPVSTESDCDSQDCFVPDITEEEFDALFLIEQEAKEKEEMYWNPAFAHMPGNAHHGAVVDLDDFADPSEVF